MNRYAFQNPCSLGYVRKLIYRHHQQIVGAEFRPELTDVLAMTFRPTDRTNSFNGNALRWLGTTALLVISYEPHPVRPGRLAMPFCGVRAIANADGSIRYGGDSGCLFSYDGASISGRGAVRGTINPLRNPTLVETLLELDRACRRQIDRSGQLVPQFPRILLGFAPTERPTFEDTPGLRKLVARETGIPLRRLGSNGTVLLERLLQEAWERQLIEPDAANNGTGLVLVGAELCTNARRSLHVYEDFTDLLGVDTWTRRAPSSS